VEEIPEAPAPAEPVPPPVQDPNQGPPNQSTLDALNAAIAEADRIRQQVIDFDGPGYFPEDWEAAEHQQRSTAGQTKKDTQGEAQAAVDSYQGLAGLYRELFQKSLPRYAEDREREIREARDRALAAGIRDISANHLLLADKKALEARHEYQEKNYYPAAASASTALSMYRILEEGVGAYRVRQEIAARDFIKYDRSNFDKAEKAAAAAVAAYEGADTAWIWDNAERIRRQYDAVLHTGWVSFAAERRAAAGTKRREALDAKANVAVRKEFDAAEAVFNRANASLAAEKYDEAADFYYQSEPLFSAAGKNAIEKRRAAAAAIKAAEEKMVESGENARNAELILEGGAL
jgi:hypothetical protein